MIPTKGLDSFTLNLRCPITKNFEKHCSSHYKEQIILITILRLAVSNIKLWKQLCRISEYKYVINV